MRRNARQAIKILLLFSLIILSTGCVKHSEWWADHGVLDTVELRESSSIPILVEALDAPDLRVRNTAAKYLRSNNDKSVINPIKNMVENDVHLNNRTQALSTFNHLPVEKEEKISYLKKQAETNSEESVQNYAKRLLDKLRTTEGISTLLFAGQESIEVKIVPKFWFFNGYKKVNISTGHGVLPFEISIKNNTSRKFKLSREKILFFSSDQVEVETVSLDDAIKRQSYSNGAAFLRGPWSVGRSISANVKVENFCRTNYFNHKSVEPHSTVTGVLFFKIDHKNIDISGSTIKIAILDQSDSVIDFVNYTFWDENVVQETQIELTHGMSTGEDGEHRTTSGLLKNTSLFESLPPEIETKIKEKCKVDFPNDFSKQMTCVEDQVVSWKKLNTL